jgi:peroxiredoxin
LCPRDSVALAIPAAPLQHTINFSYSRSKNMAFTLSIGSKAPDFALPGTDGKTHRLADFAASQWLVVSFTCNHCPYVVGNESREKAFVEKYHAKGVAYVAINSNETKNHPADDLENMKLRAVNLKFTWPYLRDDSQAVAKVYGATRTPQFFVFDKERVLRYVGRMDNSPRDISKSTTHELADAIDDLLAGKPVRVATTDPIGCNVKWWNKDPHWVPNDVCDFV